MSQDLNLQENSTKLAAWITDKKRDIANLAKRDHSLALGLAEGTLDELEAFFQTQPDRRHVIIKL